MHAVDITPTILELMGIEPNHEMDGKPVGGAASELSGALDRLRSRRGAVDRGDWRVLASVM